MSLTKSISVFLILINIIIIYNFLKKIGNISAIVFGLAAGTFVNLLIGLGIIGFPGELYEGWRFCGTLEKSTILTNVMIYSMFFSLIYLKYSKVKYINVLLLFNIASASYLIILTGSKKGMIIAILLISFFLFKKLKNKKEILKNIIILSIASFIAIFLFDKIHISENFTLILDNVLKRFELFIGGIEGTAQTDISTMDRVRFVKLGFEEFLNAPLFGIGISGFLSIYHHYSHNNYIEILSGLGIVGFFSYYSLHMATLHKIWKIKQSGIKTYLYFIILIILIMDLAGVSYYSKFSILMLSIVYFIVEGEFKKRKIND
jgi:O-antigen ligase